MDWTKIICTLLELIVPAALTALGYLLYSYLKQKGIKQEYLDLVQKAYEALNKAVLATNQEFVDILKNNGTFDNAAQELARQKCREKFEALLTDEMNIAISAIYGSLDNWLNTMREANVWEAKKTAA